MAASSSSSLISGLRWVVGLLFFSSSVFEAPRKLGPAESNLNQNLNLFETENLLANKLFRTAYHFQPTQYWMNDPNAPMYYNGHYHFFYQYNPNEAVWIQNISWGHSVSTDLIHWTGLDIALSPSHPFDINGCWSGSATLLPGNIPVILYTGLDTQTRQVQVITYPKNASDPFLREWVKPDYNPVIEPFEGIDATLFRDPSTAWLGQDGQWRLLIGTVMDQTGHAILYKSKDFTNWVRAENSLHYTNGSGMWECVDFFSLGEKQGTGEKIYLLKVSFWNQLTDHYTLGTYDEERDMFVGADASSNDYRMWPRLDYGHIYASKTFFDGAKQRRILWGWSNESDSVSDDIAKGWAGIQTVPRVLSLDSEGKQLIQWPIEEIESLRRDEIQMQNIELRTGNLVEIKGITASQADVEVEFELPNFIGAEPFDANWIGDPSKLCREGGAHINGVIGPFGLLVLAAENLEEHTAVYFRVFRTQDNYQVLMCTDQRRYTSLIENNLLSNKSLPHPFLVAILPRFCLEKKNRSSLRAELYKPASGGFVDISIKENGKISLRTLIDHSVVESFGGGGRTCILSRVYPTLLPRGNLHLFAFNNGTETVKISNLKAWNMAEAQIS